jgi:hypothetical protein
MTVVQEKHPNEQRPREVIRFQIDLPLKFHISGENIWREGWVDNMSSIDILFSGMEMVAPDKSIEIRLALPGARKGRRGATIVSRAKVTRCWRLVDGVGRAMIAAALESPRLLRCNTKSRGMQSAPPEADG